MTISRSDNKVKYECNGSTVEFLFEFPIILSSDLVVTLINETSKEEVVLVEGTNYVVAASDSGYGGGGTVTTQAAGETGMEDYAYSTNYKILIQRSIPKTQLVDLRTGQYLDLAVIEAAFDKLQSQILDMQEQIDRSIKFPAQDATSLVAAIAEAASRADKFLAFDSSGNAQASSGPIVGITPTTFAESLLGAVDAEGVRALIGTDLPAGLGPLPWAGPTAPTGWLFCYGQAISRTTYADLFTAIGTTWGVGDNSTTFNVPDMRGCVPLGKDNMGGSSANKVTAAAADTLGGADGDETKDMSHTHHYGTLGASTHTHKVGLGRRSDGAAAIYIDSNYFPASSYSTNVSDNSAHISGSLVNSGSYYEQGTTAAAAVTLDTGATATGGSATQDIMPPYRTVNYIIKH